MKRILAQFIDRRLEAARSLALALQDGSVQPTAWTHVRIWCAYHWTNARVLKLRRELGISRTDVGILRSEGLE